MNDASTGDKLTGEVRKHLAQPEFRDALLKLGLEPNYTSPKEYAETLKAAYAWNIDTIALLRKRGVTFDF